MVSKNYLVEITPYRLEVCQPIKGLEIQIGDVVLIRSDEGEDTARVIQEVDEEDIYGLIMKIADESVMKRREELDREAEQFLRKFIEMIKQFNYPMKPVHVHHQFDGRRVIFYFTADHRIDFRKLHKAISREIKKRTVIKQVGIRDYVKKFGGIGICGRELCCATFLKEFKSIPLRVAREQNLYFSPQKISGYCGKLICCLSFEEDLYREARTYFPPIGSRLRIDNQEAEVVGTDVFNRKVHLKFKNGREMIVDLKWLRRKKLLS
ncbi:stage 0 sporulation protein [candidate division WOR-3 bacterium]|uniref:Stage 0 sporulation protein n=1 Tax=candidate division WOR-3 bacterium TaxID=2052148 RepID=A0A660SK13_UNCW3|nr:MAG: stage 0 sporulation protein [candidate division WOR-3 bacterium]